MRTSLAGFLLLCTLPAVALATKAYRWKDAQGVVHIQDQPYPGAEEIELGSAQTYKASSVPAASAATTEPAAASTPTNYQSCRIAQPADDQTLFESESVTISVQVQPGLAAQDQVWLTYDGQSIAPQTSGGTSFLISPVDRGTHTVTASVRSTSGALLCQGTAISFHVRQASLLSPQNPLRSGK